MCQGFHQVANFYQPPLHGMFFTHQILGLIFFFKFQLLIILDILTIGFPLFVPLLSITWDLVFPLKSGHKKTFLEWWVSYALTDRTPSQGRKSIEKIIIYNHYRKKSKKITIGVQINTLKIFTCISLKGKGCIGTPLTNKWIHCRSYVSTYSYQFKLLLYRCLDYVLWIGNAC